MYHNSLVKHNKNLSNNLATNFTYRGALITFKSQQGQSQDHLLEALIHGRLTIHLLSANTITLNLLKIQFGYLDHERFLPSQSIFTSVL